MHKYLRAVGFSKTSGRKEYRAVLRDIIEHYDEKVVISEHEDGPFVEFSKYFAPDCGVSVCGQYDENNRFLVDYSYPFFQGRSITSKEPITVEQHADKESFAGACDDYRMGVTLIFYLQKPSVYMKYGNSQTDNIQKPLILTGLAREGTILLPLEKDKEAVKVEQELTKNRNNLIEAARNGDEDAMESLTMDDMDTYSMISERIVNEDVFTIVDSYFMPYGLECDQYNILGEILAISYDQNTMTGEEICRMSLSCNDMQFDVCINRQDLLGDPDIGRRFKGVIWLQGYLQYD